MRELLIKPLLTIACLLCGITANAYDFESEGVYYNITSKEGLTVEVTHNGDYDSGTSYTGSVTIPSQVIYDGNSYSVASIGEDSFWNCSGLTSVAIPDNVTSIGGWAFSDCIGLTSVTGCRGVYLIGEYAFDGTPWKENLPSGLNYIGKVAYLYKGTMPANTSIAIEDGTASIAPNAFSDCEELSCIEIPISVTSIGSNAFSNCSGLTSVTGCRGVSLIGEFAFDGTPWKENLPSGLNYIGKVAYLYKGTMPANTSITIEDGTASIAPMAFCKCEGLSCIEIPNSVTSIGSYVFWNCSGLTSINIPDNVTTIGKLAFCNCSGLTSVNIPDNVTSIGQMTFSGCSGLTSVNIPDNVTYIGSSAFQDCIGLTSVTIPDNVTFISGFAFMGCSGLTSVTIPDKVAYIGMGAFYGCRGLTLVNIPKSLTYIGSSAFVYCTSLKEIRNYSEQPQSISQFDFDGVDKEACTLYVPTGSLSAYKAAEGWADFLNIIEFGSGISTTSSDGVKIVARGSEITISGVSENVTVDVYSITGRHVYSGTDKTITVPDAGAYIVRVAGVTKKVVM